MRPSCKLLRWGSYLLWLFAALWIARLFGLGAKTVEFLSIISLVLVIGAGIAVLAAVIDAISLIRNFQVEVVRKVMGGFAQGVRNTYQVRVTNQMPWRSRITLIDGLPDSFELDQTTVSVNAKPAEMFAHDFQVVPKERGDFHLTPSWVRASSRWGLWERVKRLGIATEVQVYPNFASLNGGLELGLEHQIQMSGVHMMQRRGEGIDFRQLKEFVYGDSPNKVDWKASARMGKLISREYQDERDQNIIFMLDCGHRMRGMEEGYSYFDHAVNALLLTSFVALKQGDSVGLVSFAGELRWIAPVKGEGGMRSLLNQTYNLQSSVETTDYLQLAHQFAEKRPKRSLVVLITCVHADDHMDVMNTIKLLRQKHIVMLVTIEEPFLKDVGEIQILDDASAREYAGKVAFDFAKDQLFRRLHSSGVVALRAEVTALGKILTSEYLKLKRAGRI
ncbi:MAG: DUF58 domain-containing protein [Acidiferrobacterales bacterium]|nr:DUF58 domain-containing protein [Acidiferrobacterales bacterium]